MKSCRATDDDILGRILDGSLQVCPRTGKVVSFTVTRGIHILRQTTRTSQGTSYEFVEIYCCGRKKKIAVHRLVWIAQHLTLPPHGMDVHHKNGKRGRWPHRYANLELLPSSYNRAIK